MKEDVSFKLYPLDVGLMLEELLGESRVSSEEAVFKTPIICLISFFRPH